MRVLKTGAMTYKALLKLIAEALQEEIDPELVEKEYARAKNVVAAINKSGLIIVPGDVVYDEIRENLRKKDLTCVK